MTVIKFCLVLLIVYSLVLFPKIKFDNEVPFSGDAWEYHSLAVNFALSGGLMKLGEIHGDYHQFYKFSQPITPVNQTKFDEFRKAGKIGGSYSFYRAPGYIVFLGTIYKFFGVNPAIAKQIQLLLLVIIAAFLPYVGWHYWGKSGVAAGLAGGLVYLKEYARNIPRDFSLSYPGEIMAESLIAFSLFLLILTFIYWQKQTRPRRSLLLGLMTGICLLIKGTNVFIPIIVFIYLSYLFVKKKLTPLNLAAYGLGLVLTILPWSYYASKISGQTIILSIQSTPALLDNNNEYASDGRWHPEGFSYKSPNSFYSQPEIETMSLPKKLLAFYFAYPEMLPLAILEKIRLGFGGYIYLVFALILLSLRLVKELLINLFKKGGQLVSSAIAFGVIGVESLWIYYLLKRLDLFNISKPPFRVDLLLLGLTVIIIISKSFNRQKFRLDLPVPFAILFINYLMLTVIILGWPRLIQVLDFVFMLVFFRYLLNLLADFYCLSVKIIHNEK